MLQVLQFRSPSHHIDLYPYEGYVSPNAPVIEDVMRGDVNGNGTVNMDDLTALINYLVFQSEINFANAAACNNAEDTTTVNMDDLTALINYLVFNQW